MASTVNSTLFSQIAAYLTQMGLDGLFTIVNGKPGGWLYDQMVSGTDSEAALMIALENTTQFQQRYGVITELRKQAAEGKPVHVPTVAEVREYESTVASLMRQAGMPSYMWDDYRDMQALMVNGLSASEVEQRVGQSWERVQNTDPAVRDMYRSFYGVEGDAALAATFLDPTKTLSALERQSRAAYTAGMGQRMGISIDQATAERIAGLPKTDAGVFQDLTQINQLNTSGIFSETYAEQNDADLEANTTGLDAVVFGSGAASGQIERRTIERKAADRNASGGALRTQRGVTGLGTS